MTEKSKESSNRQTENVEIFDTYRQNMLRVVDEISKYQPQYAQSISNLLQAYFQVTKELINRTFAIQKSWYENNPTDSLSSKTMPYAEQYRKQSDEITSQALHMFDTANQQSINILNSAIENIKLYGKTIDTATEFNTNLANSWLDFYTSTQKQYFK